MIFYKPALRARAGFGRFGGNRGKNPDLQSSVIIAALYGLLKLPPVFACTRLTRSASALKVIRLH